MTALSTDSLINTQGCITVLGSWQQTFTRIMTQQNTPPFPPPPRNSTQVSEVPLQKPLSAETEGGQILDFCFSISFYRW